MSDLVLRFLLGGSIVSAFALIGEVVKPKTYAGIFGAAPSVAIATLGLTFGKQGGAAASVKAEWMAAATAAMLAYCIACVMLTKLERIPVWASAALAWGLWFGVAVTVWFVARGVFAQ